MCLYPNIIKNRKYTVNKKNEGDVPPLKDHRAQFVPVGCGKCIECRKQKAREWQVRLLEDVKHHTNGKFIALTFDEKQLKEIYDYVRTKWSHLQGYDIDNQIATVAVRRFLERWRKEYGKSLRHWLVTELGQKNTEHLHLHGIVWTNEPIEKVEQHWQYGWVWKGQRQEHTNKLKNYVNGQTVNYIVKYVHKMDAKHPEYKSLILTSPGIGGDYVKTYNSRLNNFKGTETNELYRTDSGYQIAMPTYWRNKIYNDEQREQLWLHRLDKEERWVRGERVSIKNGDEEYYKLLAWHRKINTRLGYGNNANTWEQQVYERQRRNLKIQERIQRGGKRIQ